MNEWINVQNLSCEFVVSEIGMFILCLSLRAVCSHCVPANLLVSKYDFAWNDWPTLCWSPVRTKCSHHRNASCAASQVYSQWREGNKSTETMCQHRADHHNRRRRRAYINVDPTVQHAGSDAVNKHHPTHIVSTTSAGTPWFWNYLHKTLTNWHVVNFCSD